MDDIHHRRLALLFGPMADLQRSTLWMALVFLDDGASQINEGEESSSRQRNTLMKIRRRQRRRPPLRWPWAHCSYTVAHFQCWRRFHSFSFLILLFFFLFDMTFFFFFFFYYVLSEMVDRVLFVSDSDIFPFFFWCCLPPLYLNNYTN